MLSILKLKNNHTISLKCVTVSEYHNLLNIPCQKMVKSDFHDPLDA